MFWDCSQLLSGQHPHSALSQGGKYSPTLMGSLTQLEGEQQICFVVVQVWLAAVIYWSQRKGTEWNHCYVPESSSSEWPPSFTLCFYNRRSSLVHIINLFLFKDPEKVAVSAAQPEVQDLYGWGNILEHNNYTKSLSKTVTESELPVVISQ